MAKAERRFKYEPRTKENIRARANQSSGSFDSFVKPQYKKYKMRDGKNIIRVLPPTWDKPDHYGYDIWVNYGIGPDNQSYLSLSKMKNEKDPLAEARNVANREGDEELAKQLQPRKRVLMWVIDRQAEEEGPQIFDAPVTVDKAMANISLDEDTREVIFIDDPEEGCDFRFYKEGSGLKTDYDAARMKLFPKGVLSEDEALQEEWLTFAKENPIPECIQFYDYDHIAAVFDGKAAKKDEDEEAKPARRKQPAEDDPKPARSRAARVEPVDEDDDPPFEGATKRSRAPVEEADEEPDDADEKPKKTESISERLKRRRAAVQPDDDED